jgi:hypothetical protein
VCSLGNRFLTVAAPIAPSCVFFGAATVRERLPASFRILRIPHAWFEYAWFEYAKRSQTQPVGAK